MKLITREYPGLNPTSNELQVVKDKFDKELSATIGHDILFRTKRADVPFRKAKVSRIVNNFIELTIPTVSAFGGYPNEIYLVDDILVATL